MNAVRDSTATPGPPVGIRGYRLLALLEPPRPAWVARSPRAGELIVATVCIGAFMGQLDASITTIALPRLAGDLHASVGAVEWVSLSYLLTLVALVAPIGSAADAVGRKALYIAGFVVFTAASAGCAFAPDLEVLCALRVVQALGSALLQANSVALITANSAPGRLRRAIGAQAAAQAIGLALGPVAGGLLLAVGSWRLLFLINVPAGIVAIVLALVLLPRSRDLAVRRPLDRVGLALFVPAICLILLTLSFVTGQGALGRIFVLLPMAAGAVAFLGFLVSQQRRTAYPLLNTELLRRPVFTRGLIAGLGVYAVLFGTLFIVPFFLSAGRLASPGLAGLELSALPAGIGIASPLAGRIADRRADVVSGGGLALCAVALLAVAALRPAGFVLGGLLGVLGLGLGAFTPANNATVMGVAPRRSAGAAAGLLNMTRGMGTALGTALAALTFTLTAGSNAHLSLTAARGGLSAVMFVLAAIVIIAAAIRLSSPKRLTRR